MHKSANDFARIHDTKLRAQQAHVQTHILDHHIASKHEKAQMISHKKTTHTISTYKRTYLTTTAISTANTKNANDFARVHACTCTQNLRSQVQTHILDHHSCEISPANTKKLPSACVTFTTRSLGDAVFACKHTKSWGPQSAFVRHMPSLSPATFRADMHTFLSWVNGVSFHGEHFWVIVGIYVWVCMYVWLS